MKILTLRIEDEFYGLELDVVEEIILEPEVTTVPNLPDFLVGVFDLRDMSLPLVDGRERLGYRSNGPNSTSKSRKVVIVRHEDELIGIRVDEAESVEEARSEYERDNPSLVDEMGGQFVQSILEIPEEEADQTESASRQTRLGGAEAESTEETEAKTRTVMLLDLNRLFNRDEMDKVRQSEFEQSTPREVD